MRYLAPVSLLLLLSASAAEQKQKPRPRQPVTTRTGCLDEVPGEQFVLLNEADMSLIVNLEPVGFPNTGFARFLGHRVRVSGQQTGSRLKVSRITTLSEVCPAPAADSN